MADSTRLQPVDVAKRLDVSTNTIRRWANEFGLHLSAEASPARGRARSFSSRDVYVLTQVHKLSQQGLTLAQIDVTLQSLELPDVVQPIQLVDDAIEAPAPVDLPEGLQLLQSMVGALDSLTSQSDRLTRLESHQDDAAALRDEVLHLRSELHEVKRGRVAWPVTALLVFVSAAVVAVAFALVLVLYSLAAARAINADSCVSTRCARPSTDFNRPARPRTCNPNDSTSSPSASISSRPL